MEIAAFGFTKKANGVNVRFCSDVCSTDFSDNPKVLNLLPAIFTLSNNNGKITILPPAGHKILQHVTDHFDEEQELLATTHTTCVCVGNSVDFPKDQLYITCALYTILRQTLVAFFVADDYSITPLTIPSEQCKVKVIVWLSKQIQRNIRSALESIVSQTGFSSFKAWHKAATQGM